MRNTASDWKSWIEHGDQYLKAGTPKGPKSRFGPDVVYNLLSMSMESYIMAILDYHNSLPHNHTYTDLINGLEKVVDLDASLKERILKYENIQHICSLEKYHRSAPSEEDLTDLKGAIMEIGDMAHRICVPKA